MDQAERNLRTFLKGECHFLDGGGPTPRRMVGRSGNEWMVQEAVLPALARTIAHSQGERGLMVCLAREADFSEMMSLAAHPEAKHGLALRLRTLCRRALPLGSALHWKLCWQLLVHREEDETQSLTGNARATRYAKSSKEKCCLASPT